MRTDIIGKVADIVEKQGTNLWFEKDDAWWAEAVGLPADTKRGNDTLDVWIDSGCSHVSVLDRHPELHCPADLYIEATDQHRGWFQSSLMMSIVARDAAPYKSVITHGFVVDTSGKKISKSDQGTGKSSKPMTADHYYNKYGGDMVRLWVSSVDYQNEVPFSEELFQQTGESYRRIRNTFRVLLGNLHDEPKAGVPSTDSTDSDSDSKSPSEKSAKSADYTLIDRWILERLHAVTAECVTAYAAYDFRKVFTVVNSFFATELSALYIDITKDRMYCDAASSPRRRATQAAIREITETLCKLLAPILAFTADETWEHLGHSDSVHLQVFPQPNPAFATTEATAAVEELLKVRGVIQQAIEKARQEKKIGSNLEATVALTLPAEGFTHAVFSDPATLHEFLILSDLQITRGGELAAVVTESSHHKCARCWKHLSGCRTRMTRIVPTTVRTVCGGEWGAANYPALMCTWRGLFDADLNSGSTARTTLYQKQLSEIPWMNAGRAFHAKLRSRTFPWGRALLFLTTYTQGPGPGPVNNDMLVLVVQGLTHDGRFAVNGRFEIHHPQLPDSADEKPRVEKHFFDLDEPGDAAEKWLDAQADESFDPSLQDYEAFLSALEIK
jgi:isoleucyl-tRNA synthetase